MKTYIYISGIPVKYLKVIPRISRLWCSFITTIAYGLQRVAVQRPIANIQHMDALIQ
jgi:hypothetical protein